MKLPALVELLERIASTKRAEKWDNVGLLLEPSDSDTRDVRLVFLTIDLTEAVLEEAVAARADLVVAYHPPIFAPLKRLTRADAKQRIALRCIESRIAVYAPHTAFDALKGGLNDWLAQGLPGVQHAEEILPCGATAAPLSAVDIFVPDEHARSVVSALQEVALPNTLHKHSGGGKVTCMVTRSRLGDVDAAVHAAVHGGVWFAHDVQPPATPGFGIGRRVTLAEAKSLSELVGCIKAHLGVPHVWVAPCADGPDRPVKSVALCAGSGGSVLKDAPADLLWTGEMSHHDILAANARGAHVVLCGHTNTERGFLEVFRTMLLEQLGGQGVEVRVSKVDCDPLTVW